MKSQTENLLIPFFDSIEKNVFKIDSVKKNRFADFYDLLIEWNSKINLISRNEKNVIDRHFLNCAAIASFREFQPDESIVDLGSGGGFPAIILKILFPESFFLLIESVKKKSAFLNAVIARLELRHIETRSERIENLSQNPIYEKQFDFVTARAVAPLKDLIPMAGPFLKTDGEMLLLKGKNFAHEIAELAKTCKNKRWAITACSLSASNLFNEQQEGVVLIVKNNL